MVGGSAKLGRGGGGGKRNIHAPPIKRPSTGAGAARLSIGGGGGGGSRGRGGAIAAPSSSSLQVEESFSLVRENPLNFAMAIKLTPDLVEEIKRVEAQGDAARIKFGANPNNSNGNVISVGDKSFKFTWSKEIPDLCDVYEERRSGEDGNGLLVESGAAWRKLNVQRVLDESTQNHVKMRSEEAERKLKSRKAIILEPNPSMKNQMKALAAAESSQRKNFMNRKEPPNKKPKSDPSPAVGPPKSVYKMGLSATIPSKGKPSGSPFSSQAEQYGALASPIRSGTLLKGHSSALDAAPSQNVNKTPISDKEMHSRLPNNTSSDKSKHNRKVEPSDLRSLMISLLLEHHSNGMSLKGLEKAIGDAMPNSIRQIEPILKQIATYQAPGRYFLKPGVDMESFKRPPSESRSSPQISHHKSPALQKFDQLSTEDPNFSVRTSTIGEEQAQLNSTPEHAVDTIDKDVILHNSPDPLSDKKLSDNGEGLAGSSSDSGSESDSDSDSSDSDSDTRSHSRSKSRSPVGSRSGSSSGSGSDSDASSNSKQASDEDVDIMTSDDDKESKHTMRDSEPAPLKSPVQWRPPDSEFVDIGEIEKQDDHVSDIVEIEKDSPVDNNEAVMAAANYSFPNQEGRIPVEEHKYSSADYHEHQERQVYDNKSNCGPDSGVNDGFKSGQSGSHERLLKGKSKRRSDDKHRDDGPQNKKLKGKNSNHPVLGTINLLFGESPSNSFPNTPVQMINNNSIDGTNDPYSQVGFNEVNPSRSTSDSPQPGQTSFEASGQAEVPSGEKRSVKHEGSGRAVKYSERGLQNSEGLRIKKGTGTESHNENGLGSERRPSKFSAEEVGVKHAALTDSHYRKHEMLGKVKEAGPHSSSYSGYSPNENNTSTADRSQVMNGRGSILRREQSDLELGEFREPVHDEIPGPKKQFERKSSFKQRENRQMDSEYWNSDSGTGKPSNKNTADTKNLTPPNSEAAVSGIPDRPSKRKVSENFGVDLARTKGITRPPSQQHQSWGDHNEVAPQNDKVPQMGNKSRYTEAGTGPEPSMGASGDTYKKVTVNATERQDDTLRGVVHRSAKESKKQKANKVGDSNRQKDASQTRSIGGANKRRESSSDENSCLYTKYEKEEPELKGPIKNVSQYNEYVKEYQEKYESYCSLSEVLESYRVKYSNMGKDLEAYRGRDMKKYQDIVGQLNSSFRQCGEKYKRQKKIFVVLFEELKHLKQMMKDFAATYEKE